MSDGRKVPVTYKAGEAAHGTSTADIVGWRNDRYREHVPRIPKLAGSAPLA